MASRRRDQSVFPFLSLSPEVRNIVYSFALTSSSIRTRRTNLEKRWTRLGMVADCPNKRIAPSTNLLLANHQIYHEASHILYHHGRFLIPAFVFNTLTTTLSKPPAVTPPSRPVRNFSELAIRAQHQRLSQIRNFEIEINWFRTQRATLPHRTFTGRLDSICRGLSGFTHLKTITVTWQSYNADPARLRRVNLFDYLSKKRTLDLLQSLRKFQDERPEVIVAVEPPSRWVAISRNTKDRARARGLEEFMERLQF